MSATYAIAGFITLAALLGLSKTAAAAGVVTLAMPNGKLSPQQVRALAAQQINQYGFNVSPDLAAAIAIVESGDVSFPQNGCDPKATRFEAAIPDNSIGLMQTLLGTAQWLAQEMGYEAYGVPAYNDLMDANTSLYFGLAYLDYLSRYKGAARSQDFIVQSYNAGPGNLSPAYLAKFKKALAWLAQNGA